MADFGISIVTKLMEVISSKLIIDICDLWGYQSELEKLEKTIIIIKAVLLDAEAKRNLSMAQRGYISDLKAAVYDADDVFDELFTLVKLKEIDRNRGGKFSFNKNKYSRVIKQMSQRVLIIAKRLDTIAADYNKFGLSIDYEPIVRRREETCSYVDVKNIIGRDSDKNAILDVLLDPSASNDFCLLSIVGVGGLGKTALAQLIYQHDMIHSEYNFSSWVSVSDQDGVDFDVKIILCNILKSLEENVDSSCTREEVERRFVNRFRGEKYFLVLDDVWNENPIKWRELELFLMQGERGSKIVVTTRSRRTASIIRSKHVYKLQGLSHKDSLRLFEMTAFEERENDPELVEMGKSIVKKCYNNPLAIKVVGSLLHGQEKSMWESIEKSGLGEISDASNIIFHTLKLSYYNLFPSLKSCFSYCALFPKDFDMDKEMLINLWLAQGYIESFCSGQSVEDAAEGYFLILVERGCFFKDVKKDKWGNITSVKMHDLMHDVAREVSGEETCVVTSGVRNLETKAFRHVYVENEYEESLMCNTRIRSYFSRDLTDKQVEDMRALRALTLCSPSLRLPSTLDKLMLLRHIKLDSANLLSLPDSITRLYNLESLILHCIRLRELPIDIGNLINLRHLDISHCASLIGLPFGMKKLTNLTVLLPCKFVVGYGVLYENFKGLQFFTQIKGHLHMQIRKNYTYEYGVSETEGTYLKDIMKHLSHLNIEFKDNCIDHEDVLKTLQLPSNLKGLTLQWYKDTTIPWSQVSFPHDHLVRIEIIQCHKLEQLPVLSKLRHLKSLVLDTLNSLKYVDEVYTEEVAEYFPSLISLEIRWLSNLKRWRTKSMRLNAFPRLSFLSMAFCPEFTSFTPDNLSELQLPCLCELHIERCGKFASNLVCPRLEKLSLDKINENLLIICENSRAGVIKQRDVVIKNRVSDLKSVRPFCLTGLTISDCIDWGVKSFSDFMEEFERSWSFSLLTLAIENCEFIRRLSGLEHLTVLQELTLDYNQQLIINEDDEEPWKSFRSLRKLKFSSLKRMKSLPKGMQHLNFLEHLVLHDCKNLEGLPKWLSCLSSLESMEIYECPGIKSFPEAIKELISLYNLSIYGCSDLEKSCREDSEKIKDITNVSYAKPSREEFFLRR